ncbi:hypothetical protein [Microbulbifer hainanensis]|uniref:hypothetical protein n=1 Tax=Microbulbifer hainanensis TaxID=2735675 RepID=UPI0018690449|nr:hypothetical protein [Microbulbifer hainanensis]
MNLFATVLIAQSLTFPIPPDTGLSQGPAIYDSPDLYGAEPSVIAMEPSAVRNRLRSLGFNPITEMRFVGGRWKVTAYWQGDKRRLEVEENTGRVLSDRPYRR